MSEKRKSSVLQSARDANEQLPEDKCPLTEKDENNFLYKHSFTKPQRCRYKCPGGDLTPCRKDPKFSPLWKADGGKWPPSGRQCFKRYQQCVLFKKAEVIFSTRCDQCTAADQRSGAKKNAKIREDWKEGKRACLMCHRKEEDGEAVFEEDKRCTECVSYNIIKNEDYAFSSTRAALPGQRWCVECNTWKKKEGDFTRHYMNLKNNDAKTTELIAMCVTCANDRLVGENKQKRVKESEEIRMEMADEKLSKLEEIRKAPGVTCGCCVNCPFNLNHTQTILVSIFGETAAKRIFSRLLEWDHNDPLKKSRNVSYIYNKAERMKEIQKCTLRCIFCHRLKTYKCGEAGARRKSSEPVAPVFTRKHFQDRLELKKEFLALTGKDGQCPGPGIENMPECPFVNDFVSLRQNMNTRLHDSLLEKEHLVMLLCDADHNDKLQKNCQARTPEELLLCTVRCCACHQAKTLISGDHSNNWVIVDSDGIPLAPVHEREANGKPMITWNMEWRASSF